MNVSPPPRIRTQLIPLTPAPLALAAVAFAMACTDSPLAEPEMDPTSAPEVVTAFDGATGMILDHRPPIPERIDEIRLPLEDLARTVQHVGQDLELAIEAADGVAMIGLKPATAPSARESGVVAAITRTEILAAHRRIEQVGGEVTRTFATLPVAVAVLPPGGASALLDFDEIDYVDPNRRGRVAGTVERFRPGGLAPLLSGQDTTWGLHVMRAPIAWTDNIGHNASITFLDTGIDFTHLTSGDGPVRLTACLVADSMYFSTCADSVPHGAHIAGLAAARDNMEGTLGVMHYEGSPAAPPLGAVRVCGANIGGCLYQTVAQGLDWTADNEWDRQVVNMSLSFDTSATALLTAVSQSVAAGNLLIAAAGRVGGDVTFPAAYSRVVGVSGTLEGDTFATACPGEGDGSSHGSDVDLSAPIWGLSMGLDGGYAVWCGTSVSAGYVSGVASLVWSKNPSWTAAQVRTQLESTARDLGASGWDQYFGHGRVDAAAAVGIPLPSVMIDGPLEVDTAGVYEWTAEAEGGLGSYTYEWYWQIDFQTQTCNYQTAWVLVEDEEDFFSTVLSELDYDFRLRVDIETHGETASDGIKVYVGDGSQICPT